MYTLLKVPPLSLKQPLKVSNKVQSSRNTAPLTLRLCYEYATYGFNHPPVDRLTAFSKYQSFIHRT